MKKILGLILGLILAFQVNNAESAVGWLKTKPASSDNPGTISTTVGENNAAIDLMLSTYTNCKITYSTAAQVTVTSGGVMVSNVAGTVRLMLANTAATTVTWANIDTGAEAASTTYYIYSIASATTDTTFTCKISTSASAPVGATYYKRLGSFYNDSSSNITQITNDSESANIAYVKGQGNYYKIDSGTGVTGAISFSFTFASAPIVILTARQMFGMSDPFLYTTTISTTGFSCLASESQTGWQISWIAIGQVLAQ